jgi:hypothetical protein
LERENPLVPLKNRTPDRPVNITTMQPELLHIKICLKQNDLKDWELLFSP